MLEKKDYHDFYSYLNSKLKEKIPNYHTDKPSFNPVLKFKNVKKNRYLEIVLTGKTKFNDEDHFKVYANVLDNINQFSSNFRTIETEWIDMNTMVDFVINLFNELKESPRKNIIKYTLDKYHNYPTRIEANTPHKSKVNNYIVDWIKQNIITIKSPSNLESSYDLKHRFSHCFQERYPHTEYGDWYIDNGNFKYAMLEAGIKPYKDDGVNAFYKISTKSPCYQWSGV